MSILVWRSSSADAVDRQLRDIARQGSGMAAVAHICAGALLILFSAASFVALGGDALSSILVQWRDRHQLDIPSTISLAVITLMVLAFDVGMLYAASVLRLLASRRARFSEQWVHVLVMVGVALIEASTYVYMAWRYEHPATWLAWALIVVRALAAPLLAVYLSMARSLPVTARDIMAQVELASGAGLIRDAVVVANDTSVPLARKAAIYGASAVMLPAERSRLDELLRVLGDHVASAVGGSTSPTDGGTPAAGRESGNDPADDSPDEFQPTGTESASSGASIRLVAPPRNRTRRTAGKRPTQAQLRAMAFGLLDSGTVTSQAALRDALGIRQERANGLYHAWRLEHGQQATPVARAKRAR